jgi:hypothetical protein
MSQRAGFMLAAFSVIPGRAVGASPESIIAILAMLAPSRRYGIFRGYGFRARRFRGVPE